MSAQNPFIHHYTTQDGLPTNTIYQIYQDSHKFLWFASDAGVIRYDGSEFRNYKKKDGLSCNDIIRIREDRIGRIWFATIIGTLDYYYENGIHNSQNSLYLNFIHSKDFFVDFIEDSNSSLFFFSRYGEMVTLDLKGNVKYFTIGMLNDNSPVNWMSCLYMYIHHVQINDHGHFLFWTSCGIFKMKTLDSPRIYIDSTSGVCGVFPISEESVMVNSVNYGLRVYDKNNNYRNIELPFDHEQIKYIIQDREGFVWMTVYNQGLFCFKDNRILHKFEIKKPLGLSQDHEGNIWVGTYEDGCYMIDHEILNRKQYEGSIFGKMEIKKMCSGIVPNSFFATTGENVYEFYNGSKTILDINENIEDIDMMESFNNEFLFLGERSNKFYIFSKRVVNRHTDRISFHKIAKYPFNIKGISLNMTEHLLLTHDQNNICISNLDNIERPLRRIYIGERVNNAFFNHKDEIIVNATKNYIVSSWFQKSDFNDLVNFDGSIIGSYKNIDNKSDIFTVDGDSVYIYQDDKYINLSRFFELPISGKIYKVLGYKDFLFISTISEIYFCESPRRLQFHQGKIPMTVLKTKFDKINDFIFINDTLIVASNEGMLFLPFIQIKNQISVSPISYIKSIRTNDNFLNIVRNVVDYISNEKLIIHFGCISFLTTNVQYAYRLLGKNPKWFYTSGDKPYAIYQNLPVGEYDFQLKVRKANSTWSTPVELKICVKPTLWENPHFRLFLLIFGLMLAFLIIKVVKNQRMKKIDLYNRLVVMEQRALQAMMNPHFIFNSLNSVQNSLIKKKLGDAIIYLSNFSRIVRQNLAAVNVAMVIFDEELNRLKNYLELEQKRLDNSFDYVIVTDSALDDDVYYIPSMIIQPFVENAIWHGFPQGISKGHIKLEFLLPTKKIMIVRVVDNGIGMQNHEVSPEDKRNHIHLGMELTQRRLVLLSKKFKVNSRLKYSVPFPDQKNHGTTVEIYIPYFIDHDMKKIMPELERLQTSIDIQK